MIVLKQILVNRHRRNRFNSPIIVEIFTNQVLRVQIIYCHHRPYVSTEENLSEIEVDLFCERNPLVMVAETVK
jgi:hypothetical protein